MGLPRERIKYIYGIRILFFNKNSREIRIDLQNENVIILSHEYIALARNERGKRNTNATSHEYDFRYVQDSACICVFSSLMRNLA